MTKNKATRKQRRKEGTRGRKERRKKQRNRKRKRQRDEGKTYIVGERARMDARKAKKAVVGNARNVRPRTSVAG
jgi:hypothetical protein